MSKKVIWQGMLLTSCLLGGTSLFAAAAAAAPAKKAEPKQEKTQPQKQAKAQPQISQVVDLRTKAREARKSTQRGEIIVGQAGSYKVYYNADTKQYVAKDQAGKPVALLRANKEVKDQLRQMKEQRKISIDIDIDSPDIWIICAAAVAIAEECAPYLVLLL